MNGFGDFRTENGSSRGENLALTVVCVPSSIDSGRNNDSCITQLKAQGPSRTCNESKEEDDEETINAPILTLLRGESLATCDI